MAGCVDHGVRQRPWDRILTLTRRRDRGDRPQDRSRQGADRADGLRLFGTTDYDPAKVTVVRTQFDSRVDRGPGGSRHDRQDGYPLLELFSTDLAEAKSNYEAGHQPVGTRQEGARLQDPELAKAKTLGRQRADRGRERRGPEPAEDEARQGQAAGIRLDGERDRKCQERGRQCRRPR